MVDRKGSENASSGGLRSKGSKAIPGELRSSTGSDALKETFSDEYSMYKLMGWCCCPECDKILYNWDDFLVHALKCVYGEQGVRMSKQKFKWSIT